MRRIDSSQTWKRSVISASLLSVLITSGCASGSVVAPPPNECPRPAKPSAEVMEPVKADFLQRMRSFLYE